MTSPDDLAIIEHVSGSLSSVYRALGELAPTLSDDAFVVATYEMSRNFGDVVLQMREYTNVEPTSVDVIDTALRQAVQRDVTGAMLLYAISMVVGPRLLVSLRDAQEVLVDERARALCAEAQDVTLRQVLAVGHLVRDRAPIEEQAWQDDAREIVALLEDSGNVESFGISR